MKVYVGISCNEFARLADFWDSFMRIQFPPETMIQVARGSTISRNRNNLTEQMLKTNADYIFYVDDDQIFPPLALQKLLKHELPVVSGLYLSRVIPFYPHTYDSETQGGMVGLRLFNILDKGVVRVLACGAGALLVRRDVLEKMEQPWWTLGQIDKVEWSDDIDFCRRVRLAGFDIHVDMECPIGHKVNGTIWPDRDKDNKWFASLIMNAREDGKNETKEVVAAKFEQKMSKPMVILPEAAQLLQFRTRK